MTDATRASLDEMYAARLRLLAKLYLLDYFAVAELCDEHIDRSGRLLGEVREEAQKMRKAP